MDPGEANQIGIHFARDSILKVVPFFSARLLKTKVNFYTLHVVVEVRGLRLSGRPKLALKWSRHSLEAEVAVGQLGARDLNVSDEQDGCISCLEASQPARRLGRWPSGRLAALKARQPNKHSPPFGLPHKKCIIIAHRTTN